MSDLSHHFFYEITITNNITSNEIDKLLLPSQQDLAFFLKKLSIPQDKFEHGFSEHVCFLYKDISFNIIQLEPHKLNFNHHAFSYERGDSIFEIFPFDMAIKIHQQYIIFKDYCDTNLEYADNFRIGLKNNKDSIDEFDKLSSCCGEYYETEYIMGNEVIFGCNYGH